MSSSCFLSNAVGMLRMKRNQPLAEVVPWLAAFDRFEIRDGGDAAINGGCNIRPRQSSGAKVSNKGCPVHGAQ